MPSHKRLFLAVLTAALLSTAGLAQPQHVPGGLKFKQPPAAHARPHGQPVTYSVSELAPFSTSTGYAPDGSGVIQASDGGLYGTTEIGGATGNGVAYVAGGGQVSPLYNFCSQPSCIDGANPVGGLIQASDGNFYGVTQSGGANGAGAIFRLTMEGQETVVYSFCMNQQTQCNDGAQPTGPLVQAADGNLYGATSAGGFTGQGVVFQFNPAGTGGFDGYSVLYVFGMGGAMDGAYPLGGMVQGSDGALYGVTSTGGANSYGVIYRLTHAQYWNVSTVYSFCSVLDTNGNCDDGAHPSTGLTMASDGTFWGVTQFGGTSGQGIVYHWDGTNLTTIENFSATNGDTAMGPLLLATDGNFYGGTNEDGVNGEGSLFQVVPGASPAVNYIYQFSALEDGGQVAAPLMQAFDGNIYGTTGVGGSNLYGNVFQLAPSTTLPSPVQLLLQPANGSPAEQIQINLGDSVTLTWSVLNAFSLSAQQCFATAWDQNTNTAGTWSGVQTGAMTNGVYSGSTTITPTAAGHFSYVLTCGGVESGVAELQVVATPNITAGASPSTTVTTGSALTINASVAGTGPTPTGTVDFIVNGVTLASETLSAGATSWTPNLTGMAGGTYTVTLRYDGDSNYNAVSTTQTVTVAKAASSTTLAVSSNAVTEGQPITVTATVTGADNTIPAGTVNFYANNGFLVGSGPLSNGVATLTYNTPVAIVGNYNGYAVYSGSAVHLGSTSNTEGVSIAKAPTSVTVIASPNPVTSPASITFLVAVSRTASGATGIAGGYVSLTYNGKALDYEQLSGGVAVISVPTGEIPPGAYSVGAIYYGDKGDAGAEATPISVTVN